MVSAWLWLMAVAIVASLAGYLLLRRSLARYPGKSCPRCIGSGVAYGHPGVTCGQCGGSGSVPRFAVRGNR